MSCEMVDDFFVCLRFSVFDACVCFICVFVSHFALIVEL